MERNFENVWPPYSASFTTVLCRIRTQQFSYDFSTYHVLRLTLVFVLYCAVCGALFSTSSIFIATCFTKFKCRVRNMYSNM